MLDDDNVDAIKELQAYAIPLVSGSVSFSQTLNWLLSRIAVTKEAKIAFVKQKESEQK